MGNIGLLFIGCLGLTFILGSFGCAIACTGVLLVIVLGMSNFTSVNATYKTAEARVRILGDATFSAVQEAISALGDTNVGPVTPASGSTTGTAASAVAGNTVSAGGS